MVKLSYLLFFNGCWVGCSGTVGWGGGWVGSTVDSRTDWRGGVEIEGGYQNGESAKDLWSR